MQRTLELALDEYVESSSQFQQGSLSLEQASEVYYDEELYEPLKLPPIDEAEEPEGDSEVSSSSSDEEEEEEEEEGTEETDATPAASNEVLRPPGNRGCPV